MKKCFALFFLGLLGCLASCKNADIRPSELFQSRDIQDTVLTIISNLPEISEEIDHPWIAYLCFFKENDRQYMEFISYPGGIEIIHPLTKLCSTRVEKCYLHILSDDNPIDEIINRKNFHLTISEKKYLKALSTLSGGEFLYSKLIMKRYRIERDGSLTVID